MRPEMVFVLLAVAFSAPQENAGTPPPQPEIRGVVMEVGTNQPVVDAEILLFGQEPGTVRINGGWKTEPSKKSRTDYRGAFTLSLDKPGPYRVEARKPGYFAPGTSAAPNYRELTLSPETPVAEVKLYLIQPGRVSGRVVNEETGKPIANLHLRAVRANARGGFELSGTAVFTDGDGQFAVKGLAPGEYAVEIRAQAAQDKRVLTQLPGKDAPAERDYEHTYWPGGHDAEAALPVTVSSGATVDIGKVAVRKVPYYRVHVRIPAANCEAGETMWVTESVQRGLGGATLHNLASAPCGKDVFVTGFSPGSYRLILAIAGLTSENRGMASVPFSIVGENIEVTAALTMGVAMDGIFLATEGTKLPDLTNARIGLRAMDYVASAAPVSPTPDGQFRIEGVRPVEQMVFIIGIGPANYVKEIRYNGAAVSGGILTLQSGAMAHKLTILIDDKPGAISGVAMSGDKPVSRPFVVAQKWPPQDVPNLSGMAGTRGDEAGRFRIAGLAPGQYHLIAVRSLEAETDHVAVELALRAAKKIEVGPNGLQYVTLEITELR